MASGLCVVALTAGWHSPPERHLEGDRILDDAGLVVPRRRLRGSPTGWFQFGFHATQLVTGLVMSYKDKVCGVRADPLAVEPLVAYSAKDA